MIIGFILTAIFGFVYLLVSLLPLINVNSAFGQALHTGSSFIMATNNYLPLPTILFVIGLTLVVENHILIYKVLQWVLKRLPTQS